MSKIELQPCRRCGLAVSPDAIHIKTYRNGCFGALLRCPECAEEEATGRIDMTREEAITAVIEEWNMRHADPALLARIAELEAERDQYRAALEQIVAEYAPSCLDCQHIVFAGDTDICNQHRKFADHVVCADYVSRGDITEAYHIARKALKGEA